MSAERVQRFEDLVAWRKARLLTAAVYRVTRRDGFRQDWGLTGQMQRAAVSIMSNLAEGFERHRASEFHQFASIAKASCAELRSQLYVAHDIGYIAQDEFNALLHQTEEVGRIIGGLRAALSRKLNTKP